MRGDAAELPPWIRSHLGVCHVIQTAQLPPPISLSWDQTSNLLEVQVTEAHYRAWMEQVASPVLESRPRRGEGVTHLFATGELRRCTMVQVRVVAVAHTVGELPQVGTR